MDTLRNPSTSGNHVADTLQAEYIREEPLNLDAERKRQAVWWETGECPGPNHVATIKIPTDQVEALRAELTFEYQELTANHVAEDNEVAAEAAAREGLRPIDPAARHILREIQAKFNEMVDQDLQNGNIAPVASPTILFMGGVYTDDDEDLHFDTPTVLNLRHGVTVIGSGTEWQTGSVDPNDYDIANGDFIGGTSPSNPRGYSTEGTVEQFITGCDPHSAAVVDEPELRITLFRTTPV